MLRKFVSAFKEGRSSLDFIDLRLEGDYVVEPGIQRIVAEVNDLLFD